MPDNEEERKSTAGIVTPNASKDDEWRREVGGIYTFTSSVPSSGTPSGPVLAAAFSPVNPPAALLQALGLA